MSLNNLVKRLQDIMRNDAGINGDAQRIEQMVWIIFLKIFNYKEQQWEAVYDDYESVIPENLKWDNWAVDNMDGKALTGDELLNFVNTQLFPALKKLEIDDSSLKVKSIVKSAFEDNNNYMKDGILLRQVINVINEIDFENYKERHAFGEIYETIEGKNWERSCLFHSKCDKYCSSCIMGDLVNDINRKFKNYMESHTIKDHYLLDKDFKINKKTNDKK